MDIQIELYINIYSQNKMIFSPRNNIDSICNILYYKNIIATERRKTNEFGNQTYRGYKLYIRRKND